MGALKTSLNLVQFFVPRSKRGTRKREFFEMAAMPFPCNGILLCSWQFILNFTFFSQFSNPLFQIIIFLRMGFGFKQFRNVHFYCFTTIVSWFYFTKCPFFHKKYTHIPHELINNAPCTKRQSPTNSLKNRGSGPKPANPSSSSFIHL